MGTFIKEEYKKAIMYIGIILAVYLGIRFLLPLVGPFVIAFCMVTHMYPYVTKIYEKTHIGKTFLAGIMLFFLLSILVGAVLLLCNGIVGCLGQMATHLENMQDEFCMFVSHCCKCLEGKTGFDAGKMESYILDKISIGISNIQLEMAPKLMGRSVLYMKGAISVMAAIVVTFIATILLVKDYGKIQRTLQKQKYFFLIFSMIQKIGHLFIIFIKAQAIIMLTIALISSLGFWILGQSNPIQLGIITSFLDVLPFIGTGIILVPLALYTVMQGNLLRAAGFIVLYAICALVREFLEPKLIGERMGIYPIGVLISIYVGIKLFGFSGIILGPIMILFIIEIIRLKNES